MARIENKHFTRRRDVIIPHGDTVLLPGDVLVVAAEGVAREAVQRLCEAPEKAAQ
jgi:Trk K+ transport system NAD-binding subunit